MYFHIEAMVGRSQVLDVGEAISLLLSLLSYVPCHEQPLHNTCLPRQPDRHTSLVFV
jgi:hypothetical protein